MIGLDTAHITRIIRSAIRCLQAMQKESGEFPTFWSYSRDMSSTTYAESPFLTGMVVLALSKLHSKEAQEIKRRSRRYLKTKRKKGGYFCFFDDGIDPDLDDTCLLNWIMQQQESHDSFSCRQLALQIALLPKRNGLYTTWVRRVRNAANDVDPCVSVNVIRFLYRNGIQCSSTVRALRNSLQQGGGGHGTLYYESPFALTYLAFTLPYEVRNRIIRGTSLDGWVIQTVLAAKEKQTLSVIDSAMLLYVLCSCAADERGLADLSTAVANGRNPGGEWPNFAVFRAFNYWGSAALTTAISIQALDQYRLRLIRGTAQFTR